MDFRAEKIDSLVEKIQAGLPRIYFHPGTIDFQARKINSRGAEIDFRPPRIDFGAAEIYFRRGKIVSLLPAIDSPLGKIDFRVPENNSPVYGMLSRHSGQNSWDPPRLAEDSREDPRVSARLPASRARVSGSRQRGRSKVSGTPDIIPDTADGAASTGGGERNRSL
jgi:hypothetical protein